MDSRRENEMTIKEYKEEVEGIAEELFHAPVSKVKERVEFMTGPKSGFMLGDDYGVVLKDVFEAMFALEEALV